MLFAFLIVGIVGLVEQAHVGLLVESHLNDITKLKI